MNYFVNKCAVVLCVAHNFLIFFFIVRLVRLRAKPIIVFKEHLRRLIGLYFQRDLALISESQKTAVQNSVSRAF